jgi:hypothetical protein
VVLVLAVVGPPLYKRLLPGEPKLAPGCRVAFVVVLLSQVTLYIVDASVLIAVSVSKDELPDALPAFSETFLFLAVILQFSVFYEQDEHPLWGLHVVGWLILCGAECLAFMVTSRGHCAIQFSCWLGLDIVGVKGLLWLAAGGLFLLQWLRHGYEECPTDEAATGSVTNDDNNSDDDEDKVEPGSDVLGIRRPAAKEVDKVGGWINFVRLYSMFLEFIWPKERSKQRMFIGCVTSVLIESFLTYLVPVQFASFTDSLEAGIARKIWSAFIRLRLLHWLTSDGGLACPRNIFWMSVSQHRNVKLTTAAHDKIMHLDAFRQSVISSAVKIQAVDSARPITMIIDDVFFQMLPQFIKLCCASVTVHSQFGSQMTLIMVCMTFLLVLSQVMLLPVLARKYDETLSKFYKANARRHDDIKGWPTVENHDQIDIETELYEKERGEHRDQYIKYTTAFYLLQGGNGLIVQIFETLAQALVVHLIQEGLARVGDMIAFVGLWPFIYEPLQFFTNFFNDKIETLFAATPLRRIWALTKDFVDETEELACPEGEIEFRDVVFSYPGSSEKVFDGLSLKIPAGKKIGFVGESGCGKSTLIGLLMRKYAIQSGAILIDGQDISKVALKS